jgi:Putative beta-lactamase-inhibitor-like, PepSY-like
MLWTGIISQVILCEGQGKSIPTVVTDSFSKMFPGATNVKWNDKIECIQAFFTKDDMKCEAKFDTSGKWISLEEQIKTDSLPKKVMASFRSSEFSHWDLVSSFVLNFPSHQVQYRLVVSKEGYPRKILSFSGAGILIKDNNSL